MEIIDFDRLDDGKAYALKSKVNKAFKAAKEFSFINMETRETMTMTAEQAKNRLSHKVKISEKDDMLYFNWVKDDSLPF